MSRPEIGPGEAGRAWRHRRPGNIRWASNMTVPNRKTGGLVDPGGMVFGEPDSTVGGRGRGARTFRQAVQRAMRGHGCDAGQTEP